MGLNRGPLKVLRTFWVSRGRASAVLRVVPQLEHRRLELPRRVDARDARGRRQLAPRQRGLQLRRGAALGGQLTEGTGAAGCPRGAREGGRLAATGVAEPPQERPLVLSLHVII